MERSILNIRLIDKYSKQEIKEKLQTKDENDHENEMKRKDNKWRY